MSNQLQAQESVMLPVFENNSSQILQMPIRLNPVEYFSGFKLGSLEMVNLQNHFNHPKAGPILAYLCFMHQRFGCPDARGFNWPIMASNRKDGKSIAGRFGIKSANTIRPILNELRVYRQFAQGVYLDPAAIDFEGMYFAAYHNGRTNDVRWFLNFEALSTLADLILNLCGHTQPVAPKNGADIDPNLRADCIPFDSVLSRDCSQIGGSYSKDVVLVSELEVGVGAKDQKQNPMDITPIGFQPEKSVGKDKKTENQNTENMEPVLTMVSVGKEENFIKEEKTRSSVYTVWKDIATNKYKQKAIPTLLGKEDRTAVHILRGQFSKQNVGYDLEELIEAVMNDWHYLQPVLDKEHNQFWAKNSSFPTLKNISQSFSAIFTWYDDKKAKDKATMVAAVQIAEQKKANAIAKAEYDKAHPPAPKKNMNASHKDGYTYQGPSGRRYKPNGDENLTSEQRYADDVKSGHKFMLAAYIGSMTKFAKNRQASYNRIIELLGDTPEPEGLKQALLG